MNRYYNLIKFPRLLIFSPTGQLVVFGHPVKRRLQDDINDLL